MARLRFGCSGWDYQEWIGPFYRSGSESKLRAYARVFDTAEINSTFYRAPDPGIVQGWGRFTPDDFVFAAKVPQTVTHDRLLDVGKGADKDLLAFCELMRPLLDRGKLGPLLLQLPPRLRFVEPTIHRFLDSLPRDFTFALEPRNKSWMTLEAFDLLRSTGVVYTIVDEPLLPPDLHVTAQTAYVRWHGHGTDPWYNYRYSEDELTSWVPRVQQVAAQAESVYGFFNNHFHGYAPENCVQILRMLGVQTQEQARALQRIEGFRKQATRAAAPLRALTLEDFGADVPKDALVAGALGRFMEVAAKNEEELNLPDFRLGGGGGRGLPLMTAGLDWLTRILLDHYRAGFFGAEVGPQDKDKVLLWWGAAREDAKDEYRLFYGDLRTEIVPRAKWLQSVPPEIAELTE